MDCSDADLIARIQASVGMSLARCCLTASSDRIVVAVSGGADSLCLLDAVTSVVTDAEQRLLVGHVDHRLRPDSTEDAGHVQSLAQVYGLHRETIVVDVPKLMADERRGLEEAARLGRYRALRDLSVRTGASTVLTGHTLDDSVETVLMHLVRGSGRGGLTGIAEDEPLDGVLSSVPSGSREPGAAPAGPNAALAGLRLVRPLLRVRRSETTAYCEARGIRWLTDPSNADPRMLRNRVRGHLLPVLRTYNPSVDQALDRLAHVMRDEEALLDALTDERYRDLVSDGQGLAQLDIAGWRATSGAIRRRIVRRIAALAGHTEVGHDAIDRALAVGELDGPPRAELGAGLIVRRQSGRLVFYMSQHTSWRGEQS